MKTKIITSLILGVLALVFLTSAVSASQLAQWDLTSNAIATNVDANIAVTDFTATGVTAGAPAFSINGANYSNWATAASADASKYYSFNITPNTGYAISLSELSFSYMGSAVGPDAFVLQYSKNSSFTSPVTIVTKADVTNTSANYSNAALNIQVNAGETVYFRILGYDFAAAGDFFNIKNLKLNGQVVNTFCEYTTTLPDSSDLELKVDVANQGAGKDKEWLALDTIQVEVRFENNKDKDVSANDLQNIIFKLGLFKKGTATDVAGDLHWISKDAEEVDVGDVDAGDKVTHVFEFKIDPSEIDLGEDYVLMVKAFPDGDESTACIDFSNDFTSVYYENIKIKQESDEGKMVVVDVDALPQPIEALCGQEVTFTADVYNIGDKDFPNQIAVKLSNTELGINLEQVVNGDLDAGDREKVTFSFRVPANAEEKIYALNMQTYYDYDEDDEDYKEVSDNEFPVSLKIAGGCVFDPKLTVSADLTSGGKAGEEMAVKATVKNTDTSSRTFTVNASGFESWAELVRVSPTTLTLAAGESKDVTIALLVNSDVEGQQEFSMDLTTADGKVVPQPVEVMVEKAGFSLTGAFAGSNNWYIWGIGALNIVLILIIILVAVRLVRK